MPEVAQNTERYMTQSLFPHPQGQLDLVRLQYRDKNNSTSRRGWKGRLGLGHGES